MSAATAAQQIQFWTGPSHLEYHRKQFHTPNRSTVRLIEFIRATLGGRAIGPLDALDAGCGAGANMFHLGHALPGLRWTGLDINDSLFPLGRRLMEQAGGVAPQPRFVAGDFERLEEIFPDAAFDLVLSSQTLSWLERYEPHLWRLLSVARPGGFVFVTSLFTDSLVDARIEITEYPDGVDAPGRGPVFYNVYCLERFRSVCAQLGGQLLSAVDFEIDTDLPEPPHRRMGTFTRTVAGGRRLQFSGPLLMPWKFLAIRKPLV